MNAWIVMIVLSGVAYARAKEVRRNRALWIGLVWVGGLASLAAALAIYFAASEARVTQAPQWLTIGALVVGGSLPAWAAGRNIRPPPGDSRGG